MRYFFLPVLSIVLFQACSTTKNGSASPIAIETSASHEVMIDHDTPFKFRLPNNNWQVKEIDGAACLFTPDGSQIIFRNQVANEIVDEARSELIIESFSNESSSLGSKWNRATRNVVAINKNMGDLPVPNMIWIANKNERELAVLHFYKKGKIFTISVEGTDNTAMENLTTLISGARSVN